MDPSKICKKLSSTHPTLLFDKSFFYVLFGQTIIATVPRDEPLRALAIFVGSFYVFDVEYPRPALLGLTVMQSILFQDNAASPEILGQFDQTMKELNQWRGV